MSTPACSDRAERAFSGRLTVPVANFKIQALGVVVPDLRKERRCAM